MDEPPARVAEAETGYPPDWSTPDTPATYPPLGGYAAAPEPPGTTPGTTPGATPGAPGATPGGPARTGPAQPFSPPGDRRWWLALGIVAALLSCCCVAAAVVALTWGPDLFGGLRDQNQRVVGLNQPVRDGDLEFRVRRVQCGVDRVGDPLVNQFAVGQFCVVQLAVRNLGARTAVFHDTLQLAYGPAGERFGVDSTASLLANADQLTFLNEIGPGDQVTGAMVYDIPADSRIVRLRLRASAGSPGAVVRAG